MNRILLADLPWTELRSPSGKFHSFCRNLSLALGGIRNAGTWGGGHPFDLQIRRIPPGASVCPFHRHLAQWEFFLVQAGSGTVRTDDGRHAVRTGDFFIHPPGATHQLLNTGDTDLEVLIVADNPVLDGCYYPDSDKWALRPGPIFRATPVDYFDGEDDAPANSADSFRPPPPPATAPLPAFAQRRRHLDDLPWVPWSSPKGRFRAASKELSLALGAKHNTPTGLGGHPFDVEYGRLAPGDSGCPFHRHAAQWELIYLLSSTATVRADNATFTAGAGELVLHPPGEAHQFTNTGDTDLLYLLVADNPPVDYWHYPDSGKWGLRAPRKFFRMTEVDYHDGEE
jgi:uncharacterized cupin superfamily protein